MGLGKVLVGVAAGLGVVAAAPVLGGVGVLTGAGALVGAGAGAIGGMLASQNKKDNGDDNSLHADKEEKYFGDDLTEEKGLAIYALSISIAHCDGTFSKEEQEIINNFIKEINKNNFKEEFKNKIEKIYKNPPIFESVVRDYISKVDKSEWDAFDTVVKEVINADGKESKEEEEYRNKWDDYKIGGNDSKIYQDPPIFESVVSDYTSKVDKSELETFDFDIVVNEVINADGKE